MKDFAFTTSDSGYKGNFLMQKNINENNPASTTNTATITSDSSSVTSNAGNTLFVAAGGVSNLSPSNQLINGWATTITAGGLALGNSSGARIVLDATSSAPKIEVYDS